MDKKNILTYEGLKKLEDGIESARTPGFQEAPEWMAQPPVGVD